MQPIYHRFLVFLLLLSAFLTSCTAQTTTPAPTATAESTVSPATPTPDQFSSLPATFSGPEAYKHVQQLASTIGSRPAGTAAEKSAADYITGFFSKLGYRAQQVPFEFEEYDVETSKLEIQSRNNESVPSSALTFSVGGGVSGALTAAGLGSAEDFAQGGFRGSIVLLERGTIRFSEKVANAAKAGAAGVIIYNNMEGELLGNLGEPSAIPVVGISRADGQRLVDLLKQGAMQMRLAVDAQTLTVKSQNVIAKGADTCRVIIGGHYDSVPAGPGANDNASGTSAVMELARVFRSQAQAKGLCFMAFGSEELGLWGSQRYVQSLSDAERQAISLMINLDMVGVGSRWSILGSLDPAREVADVANALGISVQTPSGGTRGGGGSDHASFIQAGIPAVFFYRMDDPNYHTANDTAEFIDPVALEQAGKMASGLLDKLPAAP